MSLPEKYIGIDEEGYPLFGETRVTDPVVGSEILNNIRLAENGAFMTTLQGTEAFVEAFDEPLIARHLSKTKIMTPFEQEFDYDPKTFTVDEWDRFHGFTKAGIPFVLNRNAQKEMFDLCDDYDDDSITIDKKRIPVRPWMTSVADVQNENFWTNIYKAEEARWELNQPAPALVDMLPRLKMPKSRVLILGCGSGNDAAEFARHGHVVTAVDFSAEALQRAQKKYGTLAGLKFVESDIFKLGDEYTHAFDLVFEHTCFCAIAPERRNDLINVWRKCLAEGGALLGVFFAMEKKGQPPFGGSEWEYRERLKKHFQFLFWGRLHNSIDRRQGKELLIYAKKK